MKYNHDNTAPAKFNLSKRILYCLLSHILFNIQFQSKTWHQIQQKSQNFTTLFHNTAHSVLQNQPANQIDNLHNVNLINYFYI